MLRLRALLLWLFMLALPLQGLAAAAMAYCALPGPVAAAMPAHADAHEHAGHEHGTAMPHAGHDGAGHGDAGEPDGFHKCGTCAACHAHAMVSALPVLPQGELPQADLAEAFIAPASPPLRVLDKPPRA